MLAPGTIRVVAQLGCDGTYPFAAVANNRDGGSCHGLELRNVGSKRRANGDDVGSFDDFFLAKTDEIDFAQVASVLNENAIHATVILAIVTADKVANVFGFHFHGLLLSGLGVVSELVRYGPVIRDTPSLRMPKFCWGGLTVDSAH